MGLRVLKTNLEQEIRSGRHHFEIPGVTFRKTNSSPLKIGVPKRKIVFQPSSFRCENASFREGSVLTVPILMESLERFGTHRLGFFQLSLSPWWGSQRRNFVPEGDWPTIRWLVPTTTC